MAKSPISSSPDFSSLIPSLSRLIDRVGEGELRVSLAVTDAQEVLELRDRILDLEAENARLSESVRSLEYQYRCEVVVNMELTDLLRAHKIKFRSALKDRHKED